jgi:uncharacterized membrane protein YdjX (TVP38/TMEM64 family)
MRAKPTLAEKKKLLIKLGFAGVALLVGAVLLARGLDARALLHDTIELVRNVGWPTFFAAMAVLPAVGFPLSPFSLGVAPIFAPQLGFPAVIALFGAALAANLALTYWLARYALRPPLSWLVTRLGYDLPRVAHADQTTLSVLVRVTPGPPFFIQGYLLGLAEVRFKTYMLVSWPIAMAYALVFILFGDSIAHGKGKVALLACGALAAVAVGVKLLPRRYAKNKLAATEASSADDDAPPINERTAN